MQEYYHLNPRYMNVKVFPCDSPLHEGKNMQKYSHKSSLQYLVVLPGYPALFRSKSTA